MSLFGSGFLQCLTAVFTTEQPVLRDLQFTFDLATGDSLQVVNFWSGIV
jgi:hypothetical protein